MPTITRTITEVVEVPVLAQRGGTLIRPIDPTEYGVLLERARKYHGWTQAYVCAQVMERFGFAITRQSLSAWEEGVNLPSLSARDCLMVILSPLGGDNWFAPAYSPELREALGLRLMENAPDPWAE